MSLSPVLPAIPVAQPGDPNIVYHYTSLETMQKIVETQQLWATNVKFLNDTAERTIFLSRAMQRLPSLRDEHPELDRQAFDHMLDPQRLKYDIISHLPSVVSFSKDSDSLPQWRAYCPKGRGVAIGFSVEALKRSQMLLKDTGSLPIWMYYAPMVKYGPVIYLKASSRVHIDAGILGAYFAAVKSFASLHESDRGSFGLGDYFESTLEENATYYKDGSFVSEREYRIVVGSVYSQFSLLNYRCNDWSMIPYLKVDVPNPDGLFVKHKPDRQVEIPRAWEAIRSVVIGPTADKMLTAEAVQNFFHTHNIGAEVRTTNIPFRDW